MWCARTGHTMEEIRRYIAATFDYDMNRTCDAIRPTYSFDGSCQGIVPASIIVFLDSKDYEDALRLCISLGGDFMQLYSKKKRRSRLFPDDSR